MDGLSSRTLRFSLSFFAYEHGLNCGFDFRAEMCKTFFHHIRGDLIFKLYDDSDGMCSRVG